MPRHFKDPRFKEAYRHAREAGIPRLGATIYWAYRNGLHGNECRAVKGSLAYVWWCAGHDNFAAKKPGARDLETLTRLRDLPEWIK